MFDFQPRLIGRLLALRPVAAADLDALYALGSDPLVWIGHPDRERWRPERFRAYFDEGLRRRLGRHRSGYGARTGAAPIMAR